jgi:hypothetical protein
MTRQQAPKVGQQKTYFPCVECDTGVFPEADRGGCVAFVVRVIKRGLVNLHVIDGIGRTYFREGVPVAKFDPDCSIAHCR